MPDGVTLHWHGIDVPNAEDGVAGVTQDAVPKAARSYYRFVAEDAGTFWYHSHQVSHEQVRRGLFGVVVVEPPEAVDDGPPDIVAAVHSYSGRRTISGRTGTQTVETPPGQTRRVRVVNTDNGPLRAWVTGSPFRVLAVDGRDVNEPTEVRDRLLVGHRRRPARSRGDRARRRRDGAAGRRWRHGVAHRATRRRQRRTESADEAARPAQLRHGSRHGVRPGPADRRFDFRVGRRPGFIDGRPGFWWSINGHLFPDVPMFVVDEGDVVRMTVSNSSGDVHPMHLHGHHAVVLSRNGVAATGSPWWVDSLNVEDGESYVIAFVADNPGIWMDHCHNLDHAADGLVAHLAYSGVSEPFRVGTPVGGAANNAPE